MRFDRGQVQTVITLTTVLMVAMIGVMVANEVVTEMDESLDDSQFEVEGEAPSENEDLTIDAEERKSFLDLVLSIVGTAAAIVFGRRTHLGVHRVVEPRVGLVP